MTPLGLAFRGLHFVLHIGTVFMIFTGFFTFPENIDDQSKWRAIAWLCLEYLYLVMSFLIFVYSLCVFLFPRSLPKCCAIIQDKLKDPTASNFFYYVLMSTFVLYGTMIGCHVPNLFINLNGKSGSFQTWHFFMIPAVIIGAINALLYFITAFIPIEKKTTALKVVSQHNLNVANFSSEGDANMQGIEGAPEGTGGQGLIPGATDNAKAISDDDDSQAN